LDFFTARCADFHSSAYIACKEDVTLVWSYALQATLFPSITSFATWFNQSRNRLPLFDTPSRFRPRTRAADEATAALSSCCSTNASAVRSWRSQIKNDKLSAQVFPSSFSARVCHLFRYDLLVPHACVGHGVFADASCRLPGGDRWRVLHPHWNQSPKLNAVSQPKLCRNQWVNTSYMKKIPNHEL